MGTTTAAILMTKLQKAMGDDKAAYADKYLDALNDAAEDLYPILFKPVDDRTSVTAVAGTYEYVLPTAFQTGHLSKVFYQPSGSTIWEPVFGWKVITLVDGSKYLQITDSIAGSVELNGYTKFETLTTDVSTISLEGAKLSLLIAQAVIRVYERKRGVVSMDSRARYDEELAYWRYKVEELKGRHQMMKPAGQIRWRDW